jgi:hypothetical protein
MMLQAYTSFISVACRRTALAAGLAACVLVMHTGLIAAQDLRFERSFHDFGRMLQKEKRTAEFVFTNTGQETLELPAPRASCGCTATLLSKTRIAPGDTGRISVDFTAFSGVTGVVEKTVDAFEQGSLGVTQSATLRIRAHIVAEVMPDSGMLRFSAVAGERVALRMPLHSNTDARMPLDNISFSGMEYVDTTAGDAYHVEKIISRPLTAYVITTSAPAVEPDGTSDLVLEITTSGKGQINGQIRIALPNSEVRIPVVGVVHRNRSPGASGGS